MKNNLIPFLLIIMFFACKSNTSSTKGKSVVSEQTVMLIKKYSPIIQGVWVKSDYIADIAKTRSPYKSSSKLGGAASIIINMKDLAGDSIVAGVSLNNHEGSMCTIYFKTGQKSNSLRINSRYFGAVDNFYELGYRITKNDTSLILYKYSKKHRLIESTVYSRVLPTQTSDDGGYGIQYITNKQLISGNYSASDMAGVSSNIKFDNEGNIFGFQDFKTYYLSTDFEVAIENNFDQIYFDTYSKKQKSYLYKFNADTLNLYESKESPDSTELVLGKLKYKLLRQK